MKTHVIVLAQGRQERMGTSIDRPKQLLPLDECGGVPILHRTLVQVARILWGTNSLADASERAADTLVTVVAWPEVLRAVNEREVSVQFWRSEPTVPDGIRGTLAMQPDGVSLVEPGNSSLKGIHRYLTLNGAALADRTVVLLGDVVYSWECLGRLLETEESYRFVGTRDIGPAGGEIWGITWSSAAHESMYASLCQAMAHHPPFHDTYQPGQLRRWMWAILPSFQTTSFYCAVDDYTMDVDLPEHVAKLATASIAAYDDDLRHGMVWG